MGVVFVRRDFFQGSPGDIIAAREGFSLGYKLVSDGGWVEEVYVGAGRNFVNAGCHISTGTSLYLSEAVVWLLK